MPLSWLSVAPGPCSLFGDRLQNFPSFIRSALHQCQRDQEQIDLSPQLAALLTPQGEFRYPHRGKGGHMLGELGHLAVGCVQENCFPEIPSGCTFISRSDCSLCESSPLLCPAPQLLGYLVLLPPSVPPPGLGYRQTPRPRGDSRAPSSGHGLRVGTIAPLSAPQPTTAPGPPLPDHAD